MNIVAVIPSRYESSRFRGKPLAVIKGKPMIQRVYERTCMATILTDVYVATDDRRIFDQVEAFGGKALMTGSDRRSGTDRVAEAADQIGLEPNDIVVNVQGDQPLLAPSCIDEVVAPLLKNPDIPMSTLAFKIANLEEVNDPKDCKVTFDVYGNALYFSRSPIPFDRDRSRPCDSYKHLGIYAYFRHFLTTFVGLPEGRLEKTEKLEQLRALEYHYPIRVVITGHDSFEVDLPQDIKKAEKRL